MKIIKRIFFIFIFLVQIIIGLALYAYSAHFWSMKLTILIGLLETIIAFWAYGRLFKKKLIKKSSVIKHQAIVKKMQPRKTANNSKTYNN